MNDLETSTAAVLKTLADENERLRTVLYWMIGDVEAQHRSCVCGPQPTRNEMQNLTSARAAIGSWKPEGVNG